MNDNPAPEPPQDTWASGSAYELYVGRWSRLVARKFLQWLAVPAGSHWLDAGCGTGVLSQAILQFAAPRSVKGIDRSGGYIAHAREQVQDQRINFEVGDAQALPVETDRYDAVVSGLVLNFLPQPDRALSEMTRVVKQGGVVAAYVWITPARCSLCAISGMRLSPWTPTLLTWMKDGVSRYASLRRWPGSSSGWV